MSALQVFATVVLSIVLKQLLTIGVQLTGRLRSKRFSYPEDALLPGSEAGDAPSVVHAQHLIRNSLENEPLFVLVLLTYMLAHMTSLADLGSQGDWVQSASIYAWTFLGARYVHGLTFVMRKQPWRTLSFSVGLLATIGLAVQVILDAF
ncbi:MAG: MAPEG family protein [Polyangiales bacterium]